MQIIEEKIVRNHLLPKNRSLENQLVVAPQPLILCAACLLVLFVLCILLGLVEEGFFPFLNALIPLGIFLSCLVAGYIVVVRNSLTIWTPIPWFLAAGGAYYGVGPLAYTFATLETIEHMDLLYPVTPYDLWRTNLLNLVGLCTILVCFLASNALVGSLFPLRYIPPVAKEEEEWRAKRAALIFWGVGIPVHYFLAIPHEFGILGFILPGAVFEMENVVFLGLLLLAFLAARRGGSLSIAFFCILTLEIIFALLRFNKHVLLLIIIMSGLGYYLAVNRNRVLVGLGAVVLSIYILVGPLFSHARSSLWRDQPDATERQSTLRERLETGEEVSADLLAGEIRRDESQFWWSRLSYVNTQAFVMKLYDSGTEVASWQYASYVFIPRFIWPDKPILNEVHIDFTEQIAGHRGSSTGISIFGEAYGEGGWTAVVFASALIGFLYAPLSQVSLRILARRQWLFLPCAFIGVRMGFRIDGGLVVDYLGSLVIYLVYFALIRIIFIRDLDPVTVLSIPSRNMTGRVDRLSVS
jgi:hypothetical protein